MKEYYDESVKDLVNEIRETKKEVRKLNFHLRDMDYNLKRILVQAGNYEALTVNYKMVERIFGRKGFVEDNFQVLDGKVTF
jgi:seryl-tRNA synthetase